MQSLINLYKKLKQSIKNLLKVGEVSSLRKGFSITRICQLKPHQINQNVGDFTLYLCMKLQSICKMQDNRLLSNVLVNIAR